MCSLLREESTKGREMHRQIQRLLVPILLRPKISAGHGQRHVSSQPRFNLLADWDMQIAGDVLFMHHMFAVL
jgi:hypothetical protein